MLGVVNTVLASGSFKNVTETKIPLNNRNLNAEQRLSVRNLDAYPRIYDATQGVSSDVIDQLVQRAFDGLGMEGKAGAPEERDFVFVNNAYIAWIDQTGFFGKVNGLWPLNRNRDHLDFVLLENKRPVNALIVGEDGKGEWPYGYAGCEHTEYPNQTPEYEDDPSCSRGFCSQYGLNEAVHSTANPNWAACASKSPSFDAYFSPLHIEQGEQEITFWYEGDLSKQGDFGSDISGKGCAESFMFPDGNRGPIKLRTGYRFPYDSTYLDRLIQIYNPTSRMMLEGPNNFIGGFILTKYKNPHPSKQIQFAKTDRYGVNLNQGSYIGKQWTQLPLENTPNDILVGWARQPIQLAARKIGFRLEHFGPYKIGDTGLCLCTVHGGVELGGGLNIGAVPPYQESGVSVRRLSLLIENELPNFPPAKWSYPAARLYGMASQIQGDFRRTDVGINDFVTYGPWARDWWGSEKVFTYHYEASCIRVSNPEWTVFSFDIYDKDSNTLLAIGEYNASFASKQQVALEVDLSEPKRNRLEARFYSFGLCNITVKSLQVLEKKKPLVNPPPSLPSIVSSDSSPPALPSPLAPAIVNIPEQHLEYLSLLLLFCLVIPLRRCCAQIFKQANIKFQKMPPEVEMSSV